MNIRLFLSSLLLSSSVLLLVSFFTQIVQIRIYEPYASLNGLAFRESIIRITSLTNSVDLIFLFIITAFTFLILTFDSPKFRFMLPLCILSLVVGYYISNLQLAIPLVFTAINLYLFYVRARAESYPRYILFPPILMAILIAAVSLFEQVSFFLLGKYLFQGEAIQTSWYLSNITYFLTVPFLVIIIFSWLVWLSFGKKRPHWNNMIVGKKYFILLFTSALVLSFIIPLIPYLANKSADLVGVDAKNYMNIIDQLKSEPQKAFGTVISNDMSIPLSLLYFISSFTPFRASWILCSMIFSILLFLSTYYLIIRFEGSKMLATFGGVIALTSDQVSEALAGGLYANFLALSVMNVVFALVLLPSSNKKSSLPVIAVSSIILDLTHQYSWVATLLFIISFFAFKRISGGDNGIPLKRILLSVLPFIVGGLSAEALRFLTSSMKPFISSVSISQQTFSIFNIATFWSSLDNASMIYIAGALVSQPIILALILLLPFIMNVRSELGTLCFSIAAVCSVSSLFAPYWMINRILYFFPFPLLLILAVGYSTNDRRLLQLLLVGIVLCSLSYSIYFLSSIA